MQVAERMAGAAPRVEREVLLGEAEVLQVFRLHDAGRRSSSAAAAAAAAGSSSSSGEGSAVAGCRITAGSVRAGSVFRVLRNGVEVRGCLSGWSLWS
jgi:hypothetical protein